MAAETCQKVCAISQRHVFQISILFVLTPCLQATDGNVVMAVVYLPSTVPLLVTDAGRNIRVGSDIHQGGPAGLGPTLRRPPLLSSEDRPGGAAQASAPRRENLGWRLMCYDSNLCSGRRSTSASCLSRLVCLPGVQVPPPLTFLSASTALTTSDGRFSPEPAQIYCAIECVGGFLGR